MCRAMLLVALVLHLTGNASAALVAEWKMDEGTGTSAADTLGGLPLTWDAPTPFIDWTGSGGTQSPSNALSFNGNFYPDHVGGFPPVPAYFDDGLHTDSTASSYLNFGMGSFTVALDFRTDAASQTVNGGALFMKGNTNRRYSVLWRSSGGTLDDIGMEYDSMSDFASDGVTPVTDNGKSQFYVPIGDILTNNGIDLRDGAWHQLIATLDRDELDFGGIGASPYGTLRLRIDGSIIGEMAAVSDVSFDQPNTAFNVGYADWVAGFEFRGDIDNVSVYDTAEATIPSLFDPADFNEDTIVDGADLAQWEGDFGINDDSDADGDGDSDGNDFLTWQRNLGNTSPLAAFSAVPEPSTLGLLAFASFGFTLFRKRMI